jgi:hypothetical protein
VLPKQNIRKRLAIEILISLKSSEQLNFQQQLVFVEAALTYTVTVEHGMGILMRFQVPYLSQHTVGIPQILINLKSSIIVNLWILLKIFFEYI